MRNIKLLDGTVYQVDRCGAADGQLRIRLLPPFKIVDVVKKFTNPAKTATIEHYFDGTETDHVFFDHYTEFLSVEVVEDKLLIVLKREEGIGNRE